MANEIRIPTGTVGCKFIVIFRRQNNLRFTITGASTKQVIITKPSGEVLTKTGTYVTNGADGELYWINDTAADIDEEANDYTIQGKAVISGRTFLTRKGYFDGV